MSLSKGAQRVADVLDHIAQSRTPPSSREIFECLGMPRSSGYDVLRSLNESGYLEKRADGHWTLGNTIQQLALSRFGLGRITGEIPTVLMELQEKTQEIAQFAVLDQGEVLITHVFGSLRSLHIIDKVGTRLPLNWTASGELLLSGFTERELQRTAAENNRPMAGNGSATDTGAFVRDARVAASRGYSIGGTRPDRGTSSVAAPVHGKEGRCVAAVELILPEERMRNSRDTLVSLVCSAAGKLTRSFAGRDAG